MKIAFVLLDAEVTGGQLVAHDLMRGAMNAGHEAIAVVPRAGPMVARFEADGIAVHTVPLGRSYRVDAAFRLARLLRSESVDVINTHTLYVGDQLTRIASALAQIPIVAHAHIEERFSSRPQIAIVQRVVNRLTALRCAAIVAVSHHVRQRLIAQGLPGSRIVVIHNGVRLAAPVDFPNGGTLQLICAARLAPVKGQSVLLEALAQAGTGVRVAFAGDDLERGGAYRSELEELATRLRVTDRVEFLGYRSDLRELLDQAHGLVLPSFDEGLPMVALEAMARARAVIATAAGGTPELVDDRVTGLLVEPGSVAELAQALGRVRDEPGLAERLGVAGRARVAAEFSFERTLERTLAVLEDAQS